MQIQLPAIGIGRIIAFLVLAAALLLWLVGKLPAQLALLIGGCALARLLP